MLPFCSLLSFFEWLDGCGGGLGFVFGCLSSACLGRRLRTCRLFSSVAICCRATSEVKIWKPFAGSKACADVASHCVKCDFNENRSAWRIAAMSEVGPGCTQNGEWQSTPSARWGYAVPESARHRFCHSAIPVLDGQTTGSGGRPL